jgi:short subunit dehydrogenase-like uncharacterized protein
MGALRASVAFYSAARVWQPFEYAVLQGNTTSSRAFVRPTTDEWMIYGAYGYTGRLVVERAVQQGMRPILAGRDEERTRTLAERYGLAWRVFGLSDPQELDSGVRDVAVVMHCAGPFSQTSEPMIAACLRNRVSYLDITGERSVFEWVQQQDARATDAGVVVCAGVGLDVVPTDCLAAMLHRELPDALELELALAGFGSVSRGTLKTILEGIPLGGFVRIDGHLAPVPFAWRKRDFNFPHGRQSTVTMPLGDSVTAWQTTGIPNIRTWVALPGMAAAGLKVVEKLRRAPGVRSVLALASRVVERTLDGPDERARETGWVDVAGEVRNARGRVISGTLTCPEGYRFTALSCVAAVQRVLDGACLQGGISPALAFGADFVLSIDGVQFHGFQGV